MNLLPYLPGPARFLLRRVAHDVRAGVAVLGAPPRPVFSARHGAGPGVPVSGGVATPASEVTLPVIAVTHPTRDAVAITLDATGPSAGALRAARPGQFITVRVDVAGESIRRAYSLCGPPDDTRHVTFITRRVAGGRASSWLVDHAAIGQTLTVRGPDGRFGAQLGAMDADGVVLIAGGVGITPLWSMAQARLARATATGTTRLVYANRSAASVILRREIDAAAARSGGRLTVRHVLERPSRSVDALAGRLTPELLVAALDSQIEPHAHYFVCGPEGMMACVVTALGERGVAADRIHTESFALGRAADQADAQPLPDTPRPVAFARSGVAATAQPGATVLEVARAAGVPIAFSCTMGGCASCRVRLVDGRVHMPAPNCLTAAEAAEGYILSCIARPLTPITLDA